MKTQGEVRAAAKELGSAYRIYVLEWVIAYRARTAQDAQDFASVTYGGRLKESHSEITEDAEGGVSTFVLCVRRWNVRGEWKHLQAAESWASLLAVEEEIAEPDIKVVIRNSRTEHALRAYGILKLPESELAG